MRNKNLGREIEELARGNLIVHKAMACYRTGALSYEHALEEMVLALARSEKRARQIALDARSRSRLPLFSDDTGLEGFEGAVKTTGLERGDGKTHSRHASSPLRLVSNRAPDEAGSRDSSRRH